MNRFAAAAITSTYYTVIFNFVCRRGADKCQWDSDKARELSVRVRDVCVCTDDLLSRTSAPIEVSRFVFVYDEP